MNLCFLDHLLYFCFNSDLAAYQFSLLQCSSNAEIFGINGQTLRKFLISVALEDVHIDH